METVTEEWVYTHAQWEEMRSSLLKKIAELEEDGKIIANALYEEADERDFCDDYDDFVDNLNSVLKHIHLRTLNQTFNVRVLVTQTRTQEVMIEQEARTYEDAMREVEQRYDAEEMLAETNSYDWEEESFEFEAQER